MIDSLFADLHPAHGSVPASIARVLPDPCFSVEQLGRYLHEDIAAMSYGERLRERARLMYAIGRTVRDEVIPPWIDARLEKLQPTSNRRRQK